MSNPSFTVSSLNNSSLSSRVCNRTSSAGMSPQGKFVQRLCQVEDENKLLKEELSHLKKWKTSVENWLIDSFGFVVEAKVNEDDNASVSSHASLTNSRPEDEAKSDNATFAVLNLKTELESDDNSIQENSSRDLPDTTQPPLRHLPEANEETVIEDRRSTYSKDDDGRSSSRDTIFVQEISVSVTGEDEVDVTDVVTNGTDVVSKHLKNFKQTVVKKRNSAEACHNSTFAKEPVSPSRVVSSWSSQKETSSPSPRASSSHINSEREKVNENLANEDSNVSTIGQMVEGVDSMDPTPCDICRHHLPESQNNMIYCETCNICVHQACYGVHQIPEGEWNCQPCSAKIPVSEQKCRFCTTRGGAMVRVKSPNHATWAHVSCTWWIPGVHINDPSTMDLVVGMPHVEKRRWNLSCYICKVGKGSTCCVQCVYKKCAVAFHVTCAFKKGLRMDMVDDDEAPDGILLYSFCPSHREKGPEQSAWRRSKSGSPDKKKRKIEEAKKS